MPSELDVPGLPFPLTPSGGPWRLDAETGAVSVSAGPGTDVFVDPGDPAATPALNAPTLLGVPPEGDFQFSARVTADLTSTFDAGVLLLWGDERQWGKLCFELSPAGDSMIVSVVCRGVADDANAFVVGGQSVWLRVCRIDRAYAYHASADQKTWQLVRYFLLDDLVEGHRIGFEGQSPIGDGCAVTFDQIRFVPDRLAELRDGS